MVDDRDARIAQLEAENAALREREARAETTLAEALEQQNATADILRGIALSPTNAQPVIEAITGAAGRLSNSTDAWLCIKEGEQLHYAAGYGVFSYSVHVGHRLTPSPAGVNGRVLHSRRTIHARDTSDPIFRAAFPTHGYPEGIAFVNVPLVREDEAIGLLFVARDHSQPYSPREIALLETFADQAVIAIENAPLRGVGAAQRCASREQSPGQRGTGTADRHRGGAARDRVVADSSGGGSRRDCRDCEPLVWRGGGRNPGPRG